MNMRVIQQADQYKEFLLAKYAKIRGDLAEGMYVFVNYQLSIINGLIHL